MRRLVFSVLLFIGMAVLIGCGQEREDESVKPWTEPEPWERNLGIGPFDRDPL